MQNTSLIRICYQRSTIYLAQGLQRKVGERPEDGIRNNLNILHGHSAYIKYQFFLQYLVMSYFVFLENEAPKITEMKKKK
jgi:hypothetical protein